MADGDEWLTVVVGKCAFILKILLVVERVLMRMYHVAFLSYPTLHCKYLHAI